MAGSFSWRRQLLGSLQGQIQVATYLAVFVGFTGATCAGLLVSERTLFKEHSWELRLHTDSLARRLQELPPQEYLEELEDTSDTRTLYWLDQADGPRLASSRRAKQLAAEALSLLPQLSPDHEQVLVSGGQRYLLTLQPLEALEATLWGARDITISSRGFSNYLSWMILLWALCLLFTLLIVTLLVQRIIRPLIQLSELTSQLSADNLETPTLHLDGAPQEVNNLLGTYNALLSRLAQAWSLQRQFVSGVSHELRTPLTIVNGYIRRTLRRGDNLSADQIDGLQTAAEESRRMQHLLDDLLDLSRGDSGRLSLHSDPVELVELLNEVMSLGASMESSHPLSLQLPSQVTEVMALADRDRLKQVLLNLIENARKYSPAGSGIELSLKLSASACHLSVRDHGIGVPEAERELIFERFKRGSNAPPGGGSGLGLSVVKLLMQGMGGSIAIEPVIGSGTSFLLMIPRHTSA